MGARHTIRLYLYAVLLIMGAVPVLSEAAESSGLTIQSVVPVVINAGDPDQQVHKTTLRFRQVGAHRPTALEVVEARLPGRPNNFANAFKVGPLENSTAGLAVPVEVDLKKAPFAGTYTVKTRPVYAEADKVVSPGELELSFTRPTAQLVDIPELYLERDAATGRMSPEHVHLTERSKLAFAEFSFPIVVREIRGPIGESVASQLEFRGEGPLPSGKSLQVRPVLNGSLPLGTSTGTIRLDAPQLANGVDVKFRLVNRHWLGWLPITILLFIGLALLFRKFMADRQVLDEGLLEAQRAYARLKALLDAQVEQTLRNSIAEALAPLATAIRQAQSAEAMRQAATKAGTAVDTVLTQAADSRRTLRGKIASLKAVLGRPGTHRPEMRKVMESANASMDDLLLGLDRGLLQTQEKEFASLVSSVATELHGLLQALATQVRVHLEQVGKWPGTSVDAAADGLVELVVEAEQVPLGDNIEPIVASSLQLGQASGVFLTRTLRVAVARVATQAVNELHLPVSEPGVEQLAKHQTRLVDFDSGGRGEESYGELVMLVATLRAALAALIRGQAKPNSMEVERALEEGNFVPAAKLVAAAKAAAAAKQDKIEAFGPRAVAPATATFTMASEAILVPMREETPEMTLAVVGPGTVQVGQVVEFQALLDPRMDVRTTVKWTALGGLTNKERSEGDRFSFVAQDAGEVTVQCEVRHPDLGKVLLARRSVRVEPSAAELIVMTTKSRIDRRELAMSAITGIFIAGFGTLIFMDAFVGTWRDFLYAAVWGFTIDVGAAKLRSLSDPMTSRAVPAPAAGKGP